MNIYFNKPYNDYLEDQIESSDDEDDEQGKIFKYFFF